MRKSGGKLIVISAMLLMSVMTAFADGKNLTDSITIAKEVVVNDTKLKPGTYDVKFDSETNEFSILKGSKVITTTRASVKGGEKIVRKTETYFSVTDKGLALTKLVFKGDERAILLDNGTGSAAAGQ